MAGIQKLQAPRVAQAPARAPPKSDLMRGRLTAVTEAFILLYQGSMAKDPETVTSAARELQKNAMQFAAKDQLKPALEGVLLNGADPTRLLTELARLSRESGDSGPVDELLDCSIELMRSSGSVASGSSAGLARLLFRDASQNARAIALESCVSMITEEGTSLQRAAAGVISDVYKYLDSNSREFVLDSLKHIGNYGVSPESFDPVPKTSSQETATALIGQLDSVPARVIDLSVDESGVWRVV